MVDTAVALRVEYGPRAAAAFLDACGADFRLTVRVLSEPARRRAPDPMCTIPPPSR